MYNILSPWYNIKKEKCITSFSSYNLEKPKKKKKIAKDLVYELNIWSWKLDYGDENVLGIYSIRSVDQFSRNWWLCLVMHFSSNMLSYHALLRCMAILF